MLVIGSHAMRHHGLDPERLTQDIDFICTEGEFNFFKDNTKDYEIILDDPQKKVLDVDGLKLEFDICRQGDSNWLLHDMYDDNDNGLITYAPLGVLLALKLSHRYKKDSPHFYKTMEDIKLLRSHGVEVPRCLEGDWMELREKETYDYSHPNLKVNKNDFFKDDEVPYTYDHDSIHRAVAVLRQPAYLWFKPENEEVFCDRGMFEACPHHVKLLSVYEETSVLALERSLAPFPEGDPDKIFRYALMKLCTSISSGWWREWAWEHHDEVIGLHCDLGVEYFLNKFRVGQSEGIIQPFKLDKAS